VSAKAIHVTVTMGWKERLGFLFSGGKINILFKKTMLGVEVVDVRVARQKAKRLPAMEDAHAQPH
jgi:hypothetical protein